MAFSLPTFLAGKPKAPPPDVLLAGRTRFAIGLTWYATGTQTRLEATARTNAKALGAALYVVRPGQRAQYAHSASANHVPGDATVALAIASLNVGSALGLFRVPSGWWLFEVRDGLVTPDGDRFWPEAEAETAFAEFDKTYSADDAAWDRIYAPAKLDIPGADATDLQILLRTFRRNLAKLRKPVFDPKPLITWTASIGVAALLAYGANDYLTDDVLPAPVAPAPPKPWVGKVAARAFADACDQSMRSIPATLPGFLFTGGACAGESATFTWRYEGGRLADADYVLAKAGVPPTILQSDGTTVTATVPMTGLKPGSLIPPTLPRDAIVKQTFELIHAIKAGGSVTAATGNRDLPVGWTVTGVFTPRAIVMAMPQQGSLLTGIGFDPATGVWTITGATYAR